MTKQDYEQQKDDLSKRFLQEKRDGIIPSNTGWAEWCITNGIYPLTATEAELAEAMAYVTVKHAKSLDKLGR